MSLEIGGNNGFQPFLAAAMLGPAGGRLRRHGPRLPASADMTTFAIRDLQTYPVDAWSTSAEQRVIFAAADELELDGAHVAERLHRPWARSPRPARRRAPAARSRTRRCLHTDDQGHAHRPHRPAARRAHRDPIDGRGRSASTDCVMFRGKVNDVHAAGDGGLAARHRDDRGARRRSRTDLPRRLPERVVDRLARRTSRASPCRT